MKCPVCGVEDHPTHDCLKSDKPDIAEVLHTILENQLYLMYNTEASPIDMDYEKQVEKTESLMKRIKE